MLPLRPALRLPLLAAALVAANLVHADVPVGVFLSGGIDSALVRVQK